MKGWRSRPGLRPLASGRISEECMRMTACMTSPISPLPTIPARSRYHGRKRQFSCAMTRILPAARPITASASASVGASGFWQRTSTPWAAAASIQATWLSRGEAMSSASIASPSNNSSAVRQTRRDAELGGAPAAALRVGLADGNQADPLAELPPRGQVIPADHPRPGEGDLDRQPASPDHARPPNPNRRSGVCHSTCSRSASSGSHRDRAASVSG